MNQEMYMDFENYLAGEMPHEQQLQFEKQLETDAAFRTQFDLYKETTQFLENRFSVETAAFKDNLNQISKEHFSATGQKSKVIRMQPWYYAVAASVAVVFGVLFFNPDPQYSDFNQHETAVFTERSAADNNLKNAQDFFNAHEYKKAVASFEKISDLKNPELQYYFAIALIETNDYPKAQILLDNLRSGTSVYKDKATWYLSLSSLKQNNKEACKTYLKQIPEGAEDYEKAQELLGDLE